MGDGGGSIAPFVIQMAKFIEYYLPCRVMIDSTSTQKNMAETVNALLTQRDDEGMVNLFGQKIKLPKVNA